MIPSIQFLWNKRLRQAALRYSLAAFCLILGTLESRAELGLAREAYGMWDRGGYHNVTEYPYTRGQNVDLPWNIIHTARNQYDWSGLNQLLQFADDQNQMFTCKVGPIGGGVGNTMPPWMSEANGGGVPFFTETANPLFPSQTPANFTYGYYLDPDFRIYFEEMVRAFAKHVREDVSSNLQKRIAWVRVDTGATGDETPYEHASLVPTQYQISDADWLQYRLWVFELYRQAFQEGPGPVIPLLFVHTEPLSYPDEWNWVQANVKGGFGFKYDGSTRGHHLTNSKETSDQFKPLAVDSSFKMFSRSEMDGTWEWTYFQNNIRLAMYWCAIEQLHAGQSVWDVNSPSLEAASGSGFVFAFDMFNKWAAELVPATAGGGFCIFHEGLDSSDTEKFPAATFGSPVNQGNLDRYTAICAAYASQGARMDHLEAATWGHVKQRPQQTGYNDAGWKIVRGNYDRFITQLDRDNTSKALWRIQSFNPNPIAPGGPDPNSTSHPYDRFGRSFDHASGKNLMAFDIHDSLLPSVGQRVRLAVDYLDRGTGQFEMRYDAVGNSQKTAVTVTKTNTNTWKTASVVVTDWAFGNHGPNSSDLTLVNLDSDDDIFHKLEVIKLAHVQIGTVGMGTVSGRTDATIYSPVIGDDFAESQRLELTVTPAPGWEFTGWSGEVTGTNPRPIFFPTRDSRVTATFAPASVSSSVDNFSSATWTGGSGWSGAWTTSGVATTPGTLADLRGSAQITRTLNTPLTGATLSFDWDLDRIATSESGRVEVFNTVTNTWQTVWSQNSKGGDADGTANMLPSGLISLAGTITQVRFTLNATGSSEIFFIDNLTITGTPVVAPNSAPRFSADPIGKPAAPVGVAYAGALSGNASDPNGSPLTFSKLAGGPAWLSIATDGTLSGAPTLSDLGLNRWTVQVSSSGGTDTALLLIDVTAPGPNPPAGLSYSSPPVYTKGTVITNLPPSSSGGGVMRYVATPKLPSGLKLNSTTGVISGTPVEVKPLAAYTITATNTDGSTTTSLNITVNDIAPWALTYTESSAIYPKGQAITPNTPTNSGGTVVSYAVSPPLPAGLLLDTTTGIISGTPTVAGPTPTAHTVTATNTGGSTATTLSILVEDANVNSTSITINDNAAASLYPSAIVVSPTDGTITKVTATIYGLTHARQNDLDILLVGPSGQKVLLMSDVGGGASTVDVDLTFDDAAATSLTTDAISIPTGTYKPSNSSTPDTFTAPAPAAPYGSTLSVFNGTNPTGTWSLYVMDDRANNTGSISGGWSLSFEITPPAVVAPSALSYSSNPATYAKGTAIANNTPASSGGAVVSYAVSPSLATGLTLNTTTGVISGTPAAVAATTAYTVTANNTGGSTTASVNITVNDIAPASLSYSTNPATYTMGTSIPNNTPTNSGGAVVSYAVSPALPVGLTLNTSTGVISGTPSAESAAAIHTITATNTGGSTTADLGITVVSAYAAWSTQYLLTQGPDGDDDGDGNSNYFEFVAGLVPTDASSVFKTAASSVPNQLNQLKIVISPIIGGRTYTVKSSTALNPANWIPLSNPTVSDEGSERTITDTVATEERKFYRIEINMP